jgi:hypothetical protein
MGCSPQPAGNNPASTTPSSTGATTKADSGSEEMRKLLEELDKNGKPEIDQFLSRKRAELIEQQLEKTTEPRETTLLLQQLAIEWMNAGEIEKAIFVAREMNKLLGEYDAKNESGLRPVPYILSAIASLRDGETKNCCASASANACLLPIRGDAIHTKPEGSRLAIELLTKVLEKGQDDLGVRWLLNVAYMTLGEYPAKVPEEWRIPESAFASEYPLKTFTNIAPKLGLDVLQLAGGVIAEDFNNDNYLDIIISSFWMQDELHYFVNNGDGTFTDKTKEAGLLGQLGGQNLIQADFDNDGNMDFLIMRGGWRGKGGHHPKSLLRNNGDGTFSDVTQKAGVLSLNPCMTAVWFDYNRDGWLDLFLGNESSNGEKNPCQLFRNNRDGTFTNVAKEVGLEVVGMVKAAVAIDFDHNGEPDLFLSCWKEPNKLYKNVGGKFTEVAKQAGVTEPLGSFSCFAFDYDNDGWEDLFVVDYDIQSVRDVVADYLKKPHKGETSRLFRNRGDGTFEDVTRAANLNRVLYGMGINFGDLDNDGWLDFYIGTGAPNLSAVIPNRMFRNNGGKNFQDVTTAGNFGHLQKGHAIAFADFNNDGNQDIYESMGGAYEGDKARSVLYQNPGHSAKWIVLQLEGVQSPRDAHGATIRIQVAQSNGVKRNIFRTVGSGGSFGANPLRQEIGLGETTAIEQVEIRWTSGRVQTVSGLKPNSAYRIKEGEANAMSLSLKPFPFAP